MKKNQIKKIHLPSNLSWKEMKGWFEKLRQMAIDNQEPILVTFRVRPQPVAKKKEVKAPVKLEAATTKLRSHVFARSVSRWEWGKSSFLLRGNLYYIASWSQWAVVRCGTVRRARSCGVETFGRGLTCEVRRATQEEIRKYLNEKGKIDDV